MYQIDRFIVPNLCYDAEVLYVLSSCIMVPQVITMKPMSDLCWTCQQNSTNIIRMTNASEDEISQALQEALKHLWIVKVERSHFIQPL